MVAEASEVEEVVVAAVEVVVAAIVVEEVEEEAVAVVLEAEEAVAEAIEAVAEAIVVAVEWIMNDLFVNKHSISLFLVSVLVLFPVPFLSLVSSLVSPLASAWLPSEFP